jgi:hypothetical protein
VALPSTALFDYPTMEAVSTFVLTARAAAAAMQGAGAGGLQGGRRVSRAARATRLRSVGWTPAPGRQTGRASDHGDAEGELRRRRATLLAHGSLALAPPLHGAAAGPLSAPSLRVVSVEAAAVRSGAPAPWLQIDGSTAAAAAAAFEQWMPTLDADAPRPVPLSRWDSAARARRAPSRAAARFGSFLPGVDAFDSRLFGVSPAEAALMDPQQRLVLEAAHLVLEASRLG